MKLEKIKNELERDEKLNVVVIDSGYSETFIYDNVMIINYDGNGYRVIFDEKHVLVQLLTSAYTDESGTYFDDVCDYIGGHHLLLIETVPEIVKSQIEYCEGKFGKFTEY